MKKRLNKFLSCVLAMCMIATFVPVYALDDVQNDGSEVTIVSDSETEATGSEIEVITNSEIENTSSEIENTSSETEPTYEISDDTEIDDVATPSDATEQKAEHVNSIVYDGAYGDVYVPHAPVDKPDAITASTIEEAVDMHSNGIRVWLTDDITVNDVNIDGKSVIIQSYEGPYTVTKGTDIDGHMFTVTNGATLTLENIVIDASENMATRTITVSNESHLILNIDAVLEGNTAHGAVYLDNSSLSIDGGTICNNTTTDTTSTKTWEPALPNWTNPSIRYYFDNMLGEQQGLGGAVLMTNNSTFTITSGSVTNNSATCGGAIYGFNGCNIYLNGGTLSGNTATGTDYSSSGGAIAVDGGACVFEINGSVIENNSAQNGGAFFFGMDVSSLDFNMKSGTLSKNTANNGSVFFSLSPNGVIDLQGESSLISNNIAENQGAFYFGMYPGNILSERAKVFVHDGVIFSGNTAVKGSCFYFTRDKGVNEFLCDGVTFKNNSTTNDAGVVYYGLPSSKLTFKDCVLENNKSDNRGGCFYTAADAKDSVFLFENVSFIGNYAKQQGGVWRGFPPASELTFKNCIFDKNTAELGDGGCFYCPGDGPQSNVTIDGGSFTNNSSGSSGGAFRVNLDGGKITVTGGALFQYNEADVNAGAFSIRRKSADYYGEAYLLDCIITDNVCNADFSRYTEQDLEPTKHYNTGGVYIGENITCHIYDGLVTGNYIESGYDKNMVGSGIGLCPNANAYFYPEHGALVYNNGEAGTETMDIVAVPYDETITHETPAKLYISDMTPDGRNYNWTDFDGEKVRTGEYNWDGVLNEKLSGISLMAMANNSGYQGEDNLNPVGFKANIDGTQNNPEIMTMDLPLATGSNATNEFEPKVIIKDNYTKSALYGAGGIMVNGTVIAGEFTVNVEKTVEFNGPVSQEKKDEILAQDFEFEFIISGDYIQVPSDGVAYIKSDSKFGDNDSGTLMFTSDTDDDDKQYIFAKFTLHGDQKISIGPIKKEDINMLDGTEYLINVIETDSKGATKTEYTYSEGAYLDGDRESVDLLEFTCKNTYDFNGGSLSVEKLVEGKDGDLNKMFDFSVELSDKTISGGYGEMEFSNGIANFQLKSGDKKTATGLPVGVTYTVTETNAEGYTTTSSGATGEITDNGLAEAVFTNTRDTGNLSITKTLEGNATDAQKDWHFTVTLKDNNGVANITGIYGDMKFTNGVADVVVKGGTTKTATGLPTGLTYTVEEVGANTDGYETSSSNETGKIEKDQTAAVSFTNKKSTGSLTVTKTVKTAVAADREREWNFTVTLSGKNAEITGQYGDMKFTDGVAHFTLKDGQSKTAKDLPAGVTYKVTEETDSDFETSMENGSGEITEGGTANVSFTNSRHITLPNTGASSLYIICMLAGVLAFVGIVIKKKNNK